MRGTWTRCTPLSRAHALQLSPSAELLRLSRLGRAHGLHVAPGCSQEVKSLTHHSVPRAPNRYCYEGADKWKMKGKNTQQVTVASQAVHHPFWLTSIQDLCIIGLDLLAKSGSAVLWVSR